MLSYFISFFSIRPSEEDIQKVESALSELCTALHQKNSRLCALISNETTQKKEALVSTYMSTLLRKKGITLSPEKIKLIFEQITQNKNVAEFMRENKHFKTLDPNAKLAFKLSLTFITIYCLPRFFLFLPCNILLIGPLLSFITKKLNLGLYTENFVQVCNLAALYFYHTPSAMAIQAVQNAIDQYGIPTYLIFPVSMLLREKGTAALATLSDIAESSGDFLDLMGGVAEPDVAEKYNCIAIRDVFTWRMSEKKKKSTSLTVESTQTPTQACQYRLS